MQLMRRSELGHFLNLAGLTGTGVEVGVADGAFSRQILQTWQGQRLFLVDCWEPQEAGTYCDIANTSPGTQEANHGQVAALTQADRRAQIVQAFTPQAASQFADQSLDFVYLDANHSYLAIRTDLRAWYPKVKIGGMFAGHDYLDGYLGFGPDLSGGTLFGVRTAVDEFCQQLGVAAAFTTADAPFASWYFHKREPCWPERITVLTAYESAFAALGGIARSNKEAYCRRHGYTFRCRTEGFDTSRAPAWSKIRFLQEELANCDWVFWTDADSLIMNSAVPLSFFVDNAYDVILSYDRYNGINTGNFLVRSSPWSQSFLERVWRQEEFLHHPFWENAAVMSLYAKDSECHRHISVVPNHLFNGYITDNSYSTGGFLVHFAGLKDREVFMKNYAALAR